jgi:Protein of unknown function (DUF4231)
MSDVASVHEGSTGARPPVRLAGSAAKANPLMERIDRRIAWYDRNARRSQFLFKGFKVLTLLAAAAIPFGAGLSAADIGSAGVATFAIGLLGAAIVVVEGFQQLFQWQQNWLNYRSTCETLERERSLFLARAGSYAGVRGPHARFAERAEAIMAQEHSKWLTLSEQSGVKRSDGADAPPRRGGS